MEIVCLSDLHGFLPKIREPFDLLLIAGDICPIKCHKFPFQRHWLINEFNPWLESLPCHKKIITWGNHDVIAERCPLLVPELDAEILIDDLCEFEGLRIYGLPWQRRFMDWAFNLDEPDLSHKYDIIPDCDIIISHGPPHSYGDYSPYEQCQCGSWAFLDAIDRIQPALVVYGHIHEGSGCYKRGESSLINAAIMDAKYYPRNPIQCFHYHEALVPVHCA